MMSEKIVTLNEEENREFARRSVEKHPRKASRLLV